VKERLRRLVQFLGEVRAEMSRTTWPGWPEVRGTTMVVVVTSLIFAVFLFVVDYGLRWAIDYIFAVFVQ
jgi:preprotein translocase subunit SecE